MSRPYIRDLTVVEGGIVGEGLCRGVRRNSISKTSMGCSWEAGVLFLYEVASRLSLLLLRCTCPVLKTELLLILHDGQASQGILIGSDLSWL